MGCSWSTSVIRVYLSGNLVHDRVLEAFAAGCEDEVELVKDFKYEPSSVAVIFGVRKSKVPISWPRGEVFRQQREKNLDVVVLETGYINRGDGENHHYAAGLNGLNGNADFRNLAMPDTRFKKLGVEPRPWRADGEHIILCGQVPWDASVDHINLVDWLKYAAHRIKQHTKRPIIFRPHPYAMLPPIEGCDYSTDNLAHDLHGAWALVSFNSNSGVEAALAGIPVFGFDKGAMYLPIANQYFRQMGKPFMPDRSDWLNNLAYAQWTPQEMREGRTWNHLFGSSSKT
jgi:hypothetical protein